MSNLEIFSNQDFVKIFTSTNAHVVDFTLLDTIDALPHLGTSKKLLWDRAKEKALANQDV